MDTNPLPARSSFLHRLTIGFAQLTLAGLLVSLFAPTPFGCVGIQLVLASLVAGWVMPSAGAWAVLANFTGLWMCFAIINDKRPGLSVALTLLLPATSPGFWKMLGQATIDSWGPYAWTTTLLIGVIAAVMTRSTAVAESQRLMDREPRDELRAS